MENHLTRIKFFLEKNSFFVKFVFDYLNVFLFCFIILKGLKVKVNNELNSREFRSDTRSKRIPFPLDDKLNLIIFAFFNI